MLSSAIRIIDLSLVDTIKDILLGKKLPIEKQFSGPRPGGMCEKIMSALETRGEVLQDDLYAKYTLTSFAGGEHKIEFDSSVAGRHVFVVQDFPTLDDRKATREIFRLASTLLTNNYLFQAQQAAEAAQRFNAASVHLLMPSYAYARQDKTNKRRAEISAAIVAGNMEKYYDKIVSLHLHAAAIEGMVTPGKLINLPAEEIFAPGFILRDPDTFKPISRDELTLDGINKLFSQLCVVAPDAGATANARSFARYCKNLASHLLNVNEDAIADLPLASIDKRRPGPNVCEVIDVLGKENIKGRIAEIIDDIGDSFNTACGGARALMKAGALDVHFTCSHGFFSENALEKIDASPISRVTVSDSLALRPSVLEHPRINVVSIAPVLSQVIIDLTTPPESNIRFAERSLSPLQFRADCGRYAGSMLPKLTP